MVAASFDVLLCPHDVLHYIFHGLALFISKTYFWSHYFHFLASFYLLFNPIPLCFIFDEITYCHQLLTVRQRYPIKSHRKLGLKFYLKKAYFTTLLHGVCSHMLTLSLFHNALKLLTLLMHNKSSDNRRLAWNWTWVVTRFPISMNMSWTSLIDLSSLMNSSCRSWSSVSCCLAALVWNKKKLGQYVM